MVAKAKHSRHLRMCRVRTRSKRAASSQNLTRKTSHMLNVPYNFLNGFELISKMTPGTSKSAEIRRSAEKSHAWRRDKKTGKQKRQDRRDKKTWRHKRQEDRGTQETRRQRGQEDRQTQRQRGAARWSTCPEKLWQAKIGFPCVKTSNILILSP